MSSEFVELQVTSNFSFLRGASHGEELVISAAALGYDCLGIADRNTLAGVVRAHLAAKQAGIRLLVGARLDLGLGPLPESERCLSKIGAKGARVKQPRHRSGAAKQLKDLSGPLSEGCGFMRQISLLAYPVDRAGYGRLSQLITLGRRRAPKGDCWLELADVFDYDGIDTNPDADDTDANSPDSPDDGPDEGAGRLIFIAVPPDDLSGLQADSPYGRTLTLLAARWNARGNARENARGNAGGNGQGSAGGKSPHCYLMANFLYRGDDHRRLARLAELADATGVPLVAGNDVHYHVPRRRILQDVLSCIREHCTLDDAGYRLNPNAERHLKDRPEMAQLFADYPQALARTGAIARRCRFSLDELVYEYPVDPVPNGRTPQAELVRLTWLGAHERYPGQQKAGVPEKVRALLDHELELIGQLGYAPYFLTVYDIVRFARGRGILCQGRGSAANSAVCYCLGITAVDPARLDLLFERFISAERNEPPDIDVDFEHERREEVIQYIYEKYGRERAGICATVISYRPKSAIREVGKALGLSEDLVSLLAGNIWAWHAHGSRGDSRDGGKVDGGKVDNDGDRLGELGLDPNEPRLAMAVRMAEEILGFPRHLSQHVGGFVITKGRLDALAPVENAAMDDRTFLQWDKDDLDALGILKIDVLALGMLTCIRKGFDLIVAHYGKRYSLATVPAEDEAVYDMLCLGDSIGVFQVESRAQMAMLPRLRPRNFYDLVIEVAIVRPGPIQGDMVHPYLRRRAGEEAVSFPSQALADVLGKTLGIPLFQEQAMKIAIVAAGFTPSEADSLRRAMATFRRNGTIRNFRDKMINGMLERGYEADFAERCFRQIEGFGDYGFPESHAASFALLVYVSAWMKRHYPAVFTCALLNSQPMGFYAPAQLVRDAQEHGVETRPPDVNLSTWDNCLEAVSAGDASVVIPALFPAIPAKAEIQGGESQVVALDSRFRENDNGGRGDAGKDAEDAEEDGAGDVTTAPPGFALRLGLRQIKGFREAAAEVLLAQRGAGYAGPEDLWRRASNAVLNFAMLEKLTDADAWRSTGLNRRQALWRLKRLDRDVPLPLFAHAEAKEEKHSKEKYSGGLFREPDVILPEMALGEHVVHDYATMRLSLKAHPCALLRERLTALGIVGNDQLARLPHGARVKVAGLVTVRQRPGTAQGIIFITMEDELGIANVVVRPDIFETYRRQVLGARLLLVSGKLEREGIVVHLLARELTDLSHYLDSLADSDHDPAVAAAGLAAAKAGQRRAGITKGVFSRRHPRNISLIPTAPAAPPQQVLPTQSPAQPKIKPKSRDFH